MWEKWSHSNVSILLLLFGAWCVLGFSHWGGFKAENPEGAFSPFSVTAGTIVSDETVAYAPRLALFLEGRPFESNPFFVEGAQKDEPLMPYVVVPTMLSGIFRIFSRDIGTIWNLSHLFWPFATLLLFGLWVGRLLRDRRLGFAVATIVLVGGDFFTFGFLQNLFAGDITSFSSGPILLTRHVSPAISLGILMTTLLSLGVALERGTTRAAVVAGLLIVANVYSYFFYWTVLVGIVGLIFLVSLFRKDRTSLRTITLVGVVALIGSLPWLMTYFLAGQQLYWVDFKERLGVGQAQAATWHHTLVLSVLFGLVRWIKIRDALILSTICVTGVILLNGDLVLSLPGIQKEHWHAFFFKWFEVALLLVILVEVLRRRGWERATRNGILIFAFLVLIPAGLLQARFRDQYRSEMLMSESQQQVVFFAGEKTPLGTVFFVEEENLRSRLLLYGRRPTFIHLADYLPVTSTELAERAAIVSIVTGLPWQEPASYFVYARASRSHVDQHRALVKKLVADPSRHRELLKRYRVDYLVFARDRVLPNIHKTVRPVITTDEYVVYRPFGIESGLR